jgi:FkbM family methyltransferase
MMKNSVRSIIKESPPPFRRALRAILIPPLRAYIRFAPTGFGKKALWKNLLAHLWWLETTVLARTLFGSEMRVDAEDIVGRYIYYFGVWEPILTSWVRQRLAPGDTFVDVGANVGYYSLLASQLVGDSGKVVAVEAAPQTFSVLRENVLRNRADNVRTVNMAAWDSETSLQIFSKAGNTPGTSTLMPGWAKQWNLEPHCEVPAAPLSEILTSEELKSARLIKIDVEGAEWRAVVGLVPFLAACRPDLEIVMEIAHEMLQAEGKSCEDLLALFQSMGFHPYRVENDYSAMAYLSEQMPGRPKRIDQVSTVSDQMDVIFSRVNAPQL